LTQKQILFVEDNPRQQDLFRTAVGEWNAAQEGKEFVATLLSGFEQAKEALDRTRFDCALFDLRLPTGKGHPAEEPSGNQLAHIGLRGNGIPVGIISGKPGDLDEEFRDSATVKLFFKGDPDDPYRQAIDWFAGQWQMMEVLAASRSMMRSSAAGLFALRIWPQWATLPKLPEARLTEIVTRQYVTQMAELLGLDDPANAEWHPFENYISPALQEGRAHTGDIFDIAGQLRIVLSPQCDMATKKVVNVVLALCDKKAVQGWEEKLTQLREPKSEKEKVSANRYFTDCVNQNLPASLHFLPPLPGEKEPFYVKFQDLITIDIKELNSSLKLRQASISPPFLSNLIQRFGSYMARTGQPNIDIQQFK
jgi:CheY-like chemotaxis protein